MLKHKKKTDLVYSFAKKHRLHYVDQTLKLLIFPLPILQKAVQQFDIAYQESLKERICIRRPFKYLLKIIITLMKESNLCILWGIYYRLKASLPSIPVKKTIKTHHPVAPAPLPATRPVLTQQEKEIQYKKSLEEFEKNKPSDPALAAILLNYLYKATFA